MTSFKLTVSALALVCAAAIMPQARAQDVQTNHRAVRFAGADLSTAAGQAKLRRRVHQAAEGVCGPAEPATVFADTGYASCVSQAERTAMAKANTMIAEATKSAPPAVVAFN